VWIIKYILYVKNANLGPFQPSGIGILLILMFAQLAEKRKTNSLNQLNDLTGMPYGLNHGHG